MAQLMPMPLTVSCSTKIQIGFTFLVPAYPGCPGKEAVKWLLLLLFFYFIQIFTSCHKDFRKAISNMDQHEKERQLSKAQARYIEV